jgi:hypothetical protein
MISYAFGYLMTLFLSVGPLPVPVQYTASTPDGIVLGFSPTLGWMGYSDCNSRCWVPAGETAYLLNGEMTVHQLGAFNITIKANGAPVAWIQEFFIPGQGGLWIK